MDPQQDAGGALVLGADLDQFTISPELLQAFEQAARVCLAENEHASPVDLEIRHEGVESDCDRLTLSWLAPTEEHLRSYRDFGEAAEFGATLLALQLMRRLHGFVSFERSYRGTGCDWWISQSDTYLMNSKARLEVSGILKGDRQEVITRTRKKLAQLGRGSSDLPGYAAVVSFGPPTTQITFVPGAD